MYLGFIYLSKSHSPDQNDIIKYWLLKAGGFKDVVFDQDGEGVLCAHGHLLAISQL